MVVDDTLDIEAVAEMELISSLAQVRILLDYCNIESIANSQAKKFACRGSRWVTATMV